MPDQPPPEFLANAETKSTAFLERSLEFAKEKAKTGDPIWQDLVRYTEDVLRERAKTENQLVLGADGHTYTQRQYREKRERDNVQAGQRALTGNFASALVFKLTGDAHLAGLVGGLFSAAGGTAKGYNQNKQITAPDPAPVGPPSGSPPPREVEPPSRSEQSSTSSDTGGAASPNGLKSGGLELEWITWADVMAFAEAVFGLPDDVIAAARELTAAGVPSSEETGDYLSLLAAAAGWAGTSNVSEPSDRDAHGGVEAVGWIESTPDPANPVQALDDALHRTSTPGDEQLDQELEDAGAGQPNDAVGTVGLPQPGHPSTTDDGDYDMEAEAREADAAGEADSDGTTYDMRQDISAELAEPASRGDQVAFMNQGSTGERADGISYLDDGEEGEGNRTPERDGNSHDPDEIVYLDDDERELPYLDDAATYADGAPTSQPEEVVTEDSSGEGPSGSGGDDTGGSEGAVVVSAL